MVISPTGREHMSGPLGDVLREVAEMEAEAKAKARAERRALVCGEAAVREAAGNPVDDPRTPEELLPRHDVAGRQ